MKNWTILSLLNCHYLVRFLSGGDQHDVQPGEGKVRGGQQDLGGLLLPGAPQRSHTINRWVKSWIRRTDNQLLIYQTRGFFLGGGRGTSCICIRNEAFLNVDHRGFTKAPPPPPGPASRPWRTRTGRTAPGGTATGFPSWIGTAGPPGSTPHSTSTTSAPRTTSRTCTWTGATTPTAPPPPTPPAASSACAGGTGSLRVSGRTSTTTPHDPPLHFHCVRTIECPLTSAPDAGGGDTAEHDGDASTTYNHQDVLRYSHLVPRYLSRCNLREFIAST